MRIQHNIMAMNAYRNYTNNVNALKSNLEKLSSGYRINRAGDDAAGLAISEKMRAQITGLDAAQKNVKDGISLVQTAEGALQEVQDMLNRMVYLATQSANGTYDNEVDRANLQKEVDALSTEIDRIADSANFNGIKLLDGSLEGDTVEYSVKLSGGADLTILGTKATATTVASQAGTLTVLHKDATDSALTSFTIDLENVKMTGSTGGTTDSVVTLTVGGTAVTIGVAVNTELEGADLAQEFADAVNESAAEVVTIGGVAYDVKAEGGKLVFTMNEDAAKSVTEAASFNGNFDVSIGPDAVGTSTGSINVATQVISTGSPDAGEVLASTTTNAITATQITDGFGIQLGSETYVFALTDKTLNANYGDGYKVVDVTDLVNENGDFDSTNTNNIHEALSRLTEVAKNNDMFTVGHTDDNRITVQERASYEGDVDLSDFDTFQEQIQTYSKVSAVEKVTKGGGKDLTLQIGDTADSYNQLKVSVEDMHVAALGLGGISIATQADAQAAVDKIKAAINSVSMTRGTLGATQNRLEHTANNLSVMEENITDAESSIRDTDVAEEMMAYTKNNILIQSAQAMLAQANMVPQGVLQLLG